MSQISQGEAVFQAVSKVFNTESGKAVPPTTEWTSEQSAQVNAAVLAMFVSGATTHKKNPSEAELKKYIPGLVNNWVRKDRRMNGGSKYETKRPGSRTGTGDESIKAMRTLLASVTDSKDKATIQAAIDARIAELKPKKEIDLSALPESLRHLAQ